MARPILITTPFPSVRATAKKLGVSLSRVRDLTILVDDIVQGRAPARSRPLAYVVLGHKRGAKEGKAFKRKTSARSRKGGR